MKRKNICLGIFVSMSIVLSAQTEKDSIQVHQLKEVVVTNSKFNLKRANSGKIITKITQSDLKDLQGQNIAQIINSKVGIEINGTRGNSGQNLNYYVRGGRNRQVLVLMDGIPVTDASQIANDYDLRLINTDMVESIEILKGASSVLYGTGAASAVINIQLKEPKNRSASGSFKSTFGTNNNQRDKDLSIERFVNNASFNGRMKKFEYLLSFGNQYENGLSALAIGNEKDVYNTINGNVKLGYRLSEAYKIALFGNFDKFKADFDDASNFVDADFISKSNQYRLGFSQSLNYKNGSIIANTAYNEVEREIQSSYPAIYKSGSFILDAYNKYQFGSKFYSILGINAQNSKMESFIIPFGGTDLEQSIDPDNASHKILDPYANVVYESNFGLNLNAGLRWNNHSEYGSHWVFSINPSYKISTDFGYSKLMASYSTAYITPSLYQLFEPTYGNQDLMPEENSTFELGAEIDFNDMARMSLVYFNRHERNFIDFMDLGGFVYKYGNVNKNFTASGLEFIADFKIFKDIKLNANASYTKVKEELNLRIPEFKLNAGLDYQINEKTKMSVSYQFNDDRRDAYFNNNTFMVENVSLASFSIVDFYMARKFMNEKLNVFANITNVFNENFSELYGYTTRGRNISLGFSLDL